MKSTGMCSCIVVGGVSLSLLLGGCISLPTSSTPRFYMLHAPAADQSAGKTAIASGVVIGVGPVKVPAYLDRPQMVTQDSEKMLYYAQFDRWGESLDIGIERLIGEGLTAMLPGAKVALYPWNSSLPVKYQVAVEIVSLESELDTDMALVAQWLVIDSKDAKTLLMKRWEFRQPIIPHTYAGLAATLGTACASLSGEIAASLTALETQPGTK